MERARIFICFFNYDFYEMQLCKCKLGAVFLEKICLFYVQIGVIVEMLGSHQRLVGNGMHTLCQIFHIFTGYAGH